MKEEQRYKVISEVNEGHLKIKEATGILGLKSSGGISDKGAGGERKRLDE